MATALLTRSLKPRSAFFLHIQTEGRSLSRESRGLDTGVNARLTRFAAPDCDLLQIRLNASMIGSGPRAYVLKAAIAQHRGNSTGPPAAIRLATARDRQFVEQAKKSVTILAQEYFMRWS
jgi:hypothetical protein